MGLYISNKCMAETILSLKEEKKKKKKNQNFLAYISTARGKVVKKLVWGDVMENTTREEKEREHERQGCFY